MVGINPPSDSKGVFDLDLFRDRIEQLYINERRPLKDVIKILKEEEGCYASRNMYIKKIQAWKLNKYKREDEMLQKRIEKPHAPDVAKYFKRRVHHSTGENFISPEDQLTKQPKDLDSTQTIFQLTYDIQRWIISKSLAELKSTGVSKSDSTYYQSLIVGTGWMAKNEIAAGAPFVERGLRAAELQLKLMHSSFLSSNLDIILSMTYHKLYALANMFVRFMSQLSKKTLGAHHVVTRFFTLLYEQQGENYQQDDRLFNLTFRGLRVAYDGVTSVVGKLDPMSRPLRAAVVASNRMVPMSVPEICAEYAAYIEECDQASNHVHSIASRRNYAIYLVELGQFAKAIPLLRDGGSILFRDPPPSDLTLIGAAVQSCYEWGEVLMYEDQNNYVQAEQILKTTIEKAILLLGPKGHRTITACQTLGEFYSTYGRIESAEIQRNFVLEQLAEYRLT